MLLFIGQHFSQAMLICHHSALFLFCNYTTEFLLLVATVIDHSEIFLDLPTPHNPSF